jgi:magnesium chelatase family protein
MLNGRMTGRQIRKYCVLSAEAESVLKSAMENLSLSARAHDRILRVARTIADLADSERVEAAHVAEAVGYRALDRKLWLR